MTHEIDETFRELPLARVAEAALTRAQQLGVEHADVRVERIRTDSFTLRDARMQSSHDDDERGLAVRVVHEGTWGFAASADLSAETAAKLVEQAVEIAHASAPVNTERIELAPEPSYGEVTWVSAYDVDPFSIHENERIALLEGWSRQLLAAKDVSHTDATLRQVKENKFYADLAGTMTTQQRVRMQCEVTATWVDEHSGRFETMRTIAPPVGRGWEHLVGPTAWDWDGELAELPSLLAEKAAAPSVRAGRYDLVIDPSNLWLTIHESIGHATELDRALGYEATTPARRSPRRTS